MLLGQWAMNLAGLERKFRDKLDRQTAKAQSSSNEKDEGARSGASTPDQEPLTVEGYPV